MLLDRLSNFLARVRGLPVLLAVVLVIVNLVIQFIPGLEFLARTNIVLHLALIIGFMGLLLARTL